MSAATLRAPISRGAETGLSDTTSQTISQGAKEAGTPGKRLTGALRLADAALEPTTALMGPAGIESIGATKAAIEAAPTLGKAAWAVAKNPLVRGLAEGGVASQGAGYLAKKSGASDEQKSLIEDLAFLAPGVARSFAASLGLENPKLSVQSTPEGTANLRGAQDLSYSRGPFVGTAGAIGATAFVGIGLKF